MEYAERFVIGWWGKKVLVAAIKKKPRMTTSARRLEINELCARLRQIKTDLLHLHQEKTAEPHYHAWIEVERRKILPRRPLQKDNFYYDIQSSPQDYLPHMLYMMKAVVARGGMVYNACPLRSSIIPKHFRLDTQSLIELCLTKKHGKRRDFKADGNIVRHQAEIWGLFFGTDKRCFHMGDEDGHAHRFDHHVEADGVSCSILLKRRDKVGERVREPKAEKGSSDIYIDGANDYAPLKNKGVVAIDPNMRDLLHGVDSDKKEPTKSRYTQDTRRKETKARKYCNYLQERKQEGEADGKSVVEWEAELSDYNRKTTNFANFCEYIHKMNALNIRLAPFYNEYIFRKLKLGSHMRRQVTEDRLLARFKSLIGGPEETTIAIGDFTQRRHRKYHEPVKGKGFRTLFQKAGYVLRHGLVKCTTCSRLWNRVTNAASNIWKIAMCAIRSEPRPDDLERGGPR